MSLSPGTQVTDNIRLVRLLGRGGMGSVWVAEHLTLDLEVAVKFIASELLEKSDPLVVTRFRREAQLAAKLDSPHVVRTLDHGLTDDGIPYIVMELLRGESLAERLTRTRRIHARDAARIVREVASGLSVAHAAGVVHRDIKPHNIFLSVSPTTKNEIAKVLDFGVAKATTNETQPLSTSSGVLIGTPQYMSPEQLMHAGPVDASADLWALSVTAYEMIVGKLPFRGETLAATLVAITRADLEPPSSIDTSLPTALDSWFKAALAIDPDKRFRTAEELASSLDAAMAGVVTAELPRPVLALSPAGEVGNDAATAEFLAEHQLGVPTSLREPALAATEIAERPVIDGPRVTKKRPVDEAPHTQPSPGEGSAPPKPASGSASEVSTQTALAASEPRPTGATSRSSGGARRWALIGGGAIAFAGAAWLIGHPSPPPRAPDPPTAASTPAAPSAGAPPIAASSAPSSAPVASASASVPKLGTIPKTTIAAGNVPASRVWLSEFVMAREVGDENTSFRDAEAACERRAMSLCSDAQWALACEGHPEIASEASWTATAGDRGILVRGGGAAEGSGASGCSVRSIVDPDSHDAARMGLCCTRAVGVASTVESAAFLKVTAQRLADYEKAYDSGNGEHIAALMDDPVEFHGKNLSKDEAPSVATWMARQGKLLHDVCDVALEKKDGQSSWTADCTVIVDGPSGLYRGVRRYIHGGDHGLITAVREPRPPVRLGAQPDKPK